jgi:hypothetical protein
VQRHVEVLFLDAGHVGLDDVGLGGLLDLERRGEGRGRALVAERIPGEQVAGEGEGVAVTDGGGLTTDE